jgi:prepilin-type N-terminal cleavage/methylation domain-containing protein
MLKLLLQLFYHKYTISTNLSYISIMFFNSKAFSLIELVVATSILTIAVFWVYKLIWESMKLVTNSNISTKTALLFPVVETCVKHLDLKTDSYIFIWDDYKTCEKSDNSKINKIDNIDYIFEVKNIWTDTGEIIITSDYWTTTWYLLIN